MTKNIKFYLQYTLKRIELKHLLAASEQSIEEDRCVFALQEIKNINYYTSSRQFNKRNY